MRKNKGIAVLLFAILLQLCSSGMEIPALAVGAVGLLLAIVDDYKENDSDGKTTKDDDE